MKPYVQNGFCEYLETHTLNGPISIYKGCIWYNSKMFSVIRSPAVKHCDSRGKKKRKTNFSTCCNMWWAKPRKQNVDADLVYMLIAVRRPAVRDGFILNEAYIGTSLNTRTVSRDSRQCSDHHYSNIWRVGMHVFQPHELQLILGSYSSYLKKVLRMICSASCFTVFLKPEIHTHTHTHTHFLL